MIELSSCSSESPGLHVSERRDLRHCYRLSPGSALDVGKGVFQALSSPLMALLVQKLPEGVPSVRNAQCLHPPPNVVETNSGACPPQGLDSR